MSWFIDTDMATEGLGSDDVAEFQAIQTEVNEMYEQYKDSKGVSKVSSETISDIKAFNDDIRERLTAIYDRNADLDMYNRDGMPQILDDMDTCIVESNFTGLKGFAKLFHDSRFSRHWDIPCCLLLFP